MHKDTFKRMSPRLIELVNRFLQKRVCVLEGRLTDGVGTEQVKLPSEMGV